MSKRKNKENCCMSKKQTSEPATEVPPEKCRINPALRPLLRPIADLRPDPANARRHAESDIAAKAAALRRFGQQKPIIVDPQGVIVAGNGIFTAAKLEGWTHIAVIVTDLKGPDKTGFAIADNRLGELSTWDDDALPALLESLRAEDVELLSAAGFTEEDLANLTTPEPPPSPAAIPEGFQVVILCRDEDHQRQLFDRFKKEGMECRLLTL